MSIATPLAPHRSAQTLTARQTLRRGARHLWAAALALHRAARIATHARRRRAADQTALTGMSAQDLRDLAIGRGEIESWCAATPPTEKGPRP